MIGPNRLAKFDPNRTCEDCAERKVLPCHIESPSQVEPRPAVSQIQENGRESKAALPERPTSIPPALPISRLDDFGVRDFRCCKLLRLCAHTVCSSNATTSPTRRLPSPSIGMKSTNRQRRGSTARSSVDESSRRSFRSKRNFPSRSISATPAADSFTTAPRYVRLPPRPTTAASLTHGSPASSRSSRSRLTRLPSTLTTRSIRPSRRKRPSAAERNSVGLLAPTMAGRVRRSQPQNSVIARSNLD